MGLQIGGLVGQQGISRGVALVETVAGELLHQVEDPVGLGLAVARVRRSPA